MLEVAFYKYALINVIMYLYVLRHLTDTFGSTLRKNSRLFFPGKAGRDRAVPVNLIMTYLQWAECPSHWATVVVTFLKTAVG